MDSRSGRWPRLPGILTTAGGVLFTGDVAGSIFALDAATGKILWHAYGGGNFNGSPITYQLDGKQLAD